MDVDVEMLWSLPLKYTLTNQWMKNIIEINYFIENRQK